MKVKASIALLLIFTLTSSAFAQDKNSNPLKTSRWEHGVDRCKRAFAIVGQQSVSGRIVRGTLFVGGAAILTYLFSLFVNDLSQIQDEKDPKPRRRLLEQWRPRI